MNQEAYAEKLKAQLDEWSADLDKLEAKARGATADALPGHPARFRDAERAGRHPCGARRRGSGLRGLAEDTGDQSGKSSTLMKVNGLHIGFTDEGRGLAPLFVHGFPLRRKAWQKQGEALRSSYRIIAPDLRGFGESEGAAGTVTMPEQVRSNGVRAVVAAMAPKMLATDNRDP